MWDSSDTSEANTSTPGHQWASGWHPGVCLRGTRKVQLYPEQLPGLAVQSNKQPLWTWGRPGSCPPPMGDHLWPCSRGGGCPDQQMGPHMHTLGGREGSGGERQRWPPPKPRLPPKRRLPVSTGTRCSSLFSSSWASIWHSLFSMLPWLSPACPPRTASAPLSTTLSRRHAGCDRRGGKQTMLCVDHGPQVREGHARMPAHAACAVLCVTRGSRRVLVTGSWEETCSPLPWAPQPPPLRPLLGLHVASQRRQQDARGTHSTFLSWEGSLNRLASLVAELLEDKRSDYEANRGRTAEMPAGRRNQAWRRSQAEGRPLAVVSDPALGGSASTRHRPPPTNGWTAPQLLTELRATLPTATPAQPRLTLHHQPVPTGSAGQHFPTRRTRWLTGWLAGSGDDSRSSTTSLECFS